MSRVRTRTVWTSDNGARFWKGGASYTELYKPYRTFQVQDGVTFRAAPLAQDEYYHLYDRVRYESFTDVAVNTGGRRFNPCVHLKVEASHFPDFDGKGFPCDNDGYYSYSCWRNASSGFWVMPGNYNALLSDLQTSAQNVDWTSEVIALANLVKGLVNSKTLMAVTIKELPETIRMVCNPFGLLKGDWRRLAKRHSAAHLAKHGANLWLEKQYGWGASLYDFKQFAKSCEKYASSLYRFRDRVLERFGKKTETSISPPSPTVSDSTWSQWKSMVANNVSFSPNHPRVRVIFGSGLMSCNVSCYATDALSASVSALHKMLFAYGLHWSQILESIWEAIPYSFVVDWFVNMNDLMSQPFFLSNALSTLQSTAVRSLGYSAKATIPFYGITLPECYSTEWWSGAWAMRLTPISTNEVKGKPGYVTYYQRWLGMPPCGSPSFWAGKGLRISQYASGFSLLFQRLRLR